MRMPELSVGEARRLQLLYLADWSIETGHGIAPPKLEGEMGWTERQMVRRVDATIAGARGEAPQAEPPGGPQFGRTKLEIVVHA